ncbi:AAA family ATPase [Streptomyces albus]|uniref:AAA family ATPase n=1 Tax=Streptomyces TaxID=1883 RepID=UPI0004C8FDBC|nr:MULTISPECIES: AAA family ATPase [Streptomyces]QID35124.1 AAA family ATPase [Streptomyces albus]
MAGDVNLDAMATVHDTLVLEGPDGVGKSTLAERLSAQHGFQVIHSPRTPDHLDLATRYREILDRTGRILFDRCFVSELVYGPLHRGRSRITWSDALDLAERVIDRAGLFVHLTAAPPVIRQRLLDRDGEAAGLEEVAALVTAYQRVFSTLADYTKVLTLDTTAGELPSAG